MKSSLFLLFLMLALTACESSHLDIAASPISPQAQRIKKLLVVEDFEFSSFWQSNFESDFSLSLKKCGVYVKYYDAKDKKKMRLERKNEGMLNEISDEAKTFNADTILQFTNDSFSSSSNPRLGKTGTSFHFSFIFIDANSRQSLQNGTILIWMPATYPPILYSGGQNITSALSDKMQTSKFLDNCDTTSSP